MATNKERIEASEAGFGGIQDGMQRLEETINRLSEVFLSTKDNSSNHNNGRKGFIQPHREENDGSKQIFSSKMAKLKFPKYSGDDPIEWFNRVAQFFKFRGTTNNQKVGSLRDYQKEFKRLGNRVHGWSQKTLVGSFMGGLRSEISETIHMFKPETGPQLLLLEGNIDDESEGDNNEANTDLPSDPEISLHALTGWTAVKTIHVTTKIGTYEVVVLINSGSTHNFISDKVAALLRLPVVPTEPFNVRVANG
ncbi:hypothetical protein Pint_07341 [Pistacia integerrima]|uniref:Uncharacterized protein n=1 Tax=Pistacia integerrima TaxID=434235 RepID=A0ACC0XYG1_9ROSI|nr:hypothetical protein Pint_07341 [Pistacia integerrima]